MNLSLASPFLLVAATLIPPSAASPEIREDFLYKADLNDGGIAMNVGDIGICPGGLAKYAPVSVQSSSNDWFRLGLNVEAANSTRWVAWNETTNLGPNPAGRLEPFEPVLLHPSRGPEPVQKLYNLIYWPPQEGRGTDRFWVTVEVEAMDEPFRVPSTAGPQLLEISYGMPIDCPGILAGPAVESQSSTTPFSILVPLVALIGMALIQRR